MKKILCIVSKDVIKRNIYDTDFWSSVVKKNPDTEFHLLVEVGKDYDFSGPNVFIHEYDRHSYKGYNKIVFFLVRTGINSHSTKTYRMRAYKRGEASFKQLFVKEIIAKTLGNIGLYKKFVRFLVSKMDIDNDLKSIFDEVKPDLVFAPSLIDNDYDVPVSVFARNSGIRVVGMVRSWDNLNNHGILSFVPDRFIVQNTWLIETAEKFQAIKKDSIKDVIGLPHYDEYKNPEQLIKSKEEFFNELGLDITKKLILVGGSDFYYSEDKLPQILNDAISNKEIKESSQIYFRPHPRSLFSRDEYNLDNLEHVTLDGGKNAVTGFSDGDKLINLLYHSDIIIQIASTMAIDASVFETPTICINFDSPLKNISYWERVTRLYDTFDHYEKLVSSGGARTSESKEELIEDINDYLKNPKLDSEGRQKMLDFFVEPFDGKSGERLANILTEEIRT
jgi:hypothetical protein